MVELADSCRLPDRVGHCECIVPIQGTVIKGVLVGSANTAFRLEFFSSEACDVSGYGEGQATWDPHR